MADFAVGFVVDFDQMHRTSSLVVVVGFGLEEGRSQGSWFAAAVVV